VEIFARQEEATALLRVLHGFLIFNCPLFSDEQIAFDLDPRDITNADQFMTLFEFMRGVSAIPNEIVLTPETFGQPRCSSFLHRHKPGSSVYDLTQLSFTAGHYACRSGRRATWTALKYSLGTMSVLGPSRQDHAPLIQP